MLSQLDQLLRSTNTIISVEAFRILEVSTPPSLFFHSGNTNTPIQLPALNRVLVNYIT